MSSEWALGGFVRCLYTTNLTLWGRFCDLVSKDVFSFVLVRSGHLSSHGSGCFFLFMTIQQNFGHLLSPGKGCFFNDLGNLFGFPSFAKFYI